MSQQGGDFSGVISVFRDQARAGDPITVEGDGTQTRDFVHVDDVVQANLLAATDATGEAFNIGTGTTITIRNLAESIRDVTDSESEIVHVDPRDGDIDHQSGRHHESTVATRLRAKVLDRSGAASVSRRRGLRTPPPYSSMGRASRRALDDQRRVNDWGRRPRSTEARGRLRRTRSGQ
jgi:nucleoside-diphosphate-sugar epimerase